MVAATTGKGYTPKKDYLAVAKTKIVRAREVVKHPKVLIYGRKKVGKTTLALTADQPDRMLIVDPEDGAVYKTKTNPYIWPIDRWADMEDVYGALRTGKLTPNHLKQGESSTPFQFSILDGMTRINNLALHHVRREQEERNLDRIPGFIDRRDYGKSGELMKQMMANFETLKMGVIYTTHERMKTAANFEEDEDDEGNEVFYVPDLPDAVRNHVNALVDVIGRLYIVRLDDPKNVGKKVAYRRLHIGPSDAYDTGYRSEYKLPDVLKSPSIPKLLKLMKEGS
jgi:AAA domain